jgi:hypothetical protein
MEEVVHAWLVTQPKTFLSDGTEKCVDVWKKCDEKDRDYTKKLC